MDDKRNIPKWGFGMAPISARMQGRYDLAVDALLSFFEGYLSLSELDPDLVSELKGMFNRCIRKDQWDWFSVYSQFGEPTQPQLHRIVPLLYALRKNLAATDADAVADLHKRLKETDILTYLKIFRAGGPEHDKDGISGWLYILSTRREPHILKIGMTTRSVSQRVKEINRATGVLYPFSPRAVFRVADAAAAEKDIFLLLRDYRVRADREFFEVDYDYAAREIDQFLFSRRY
jgi:hypothetical protein